MFVHKITTDQYERFTWYDLNRQIRKTNYDMTSEKKNFYLKILEDVLEGRWKIDETCKIMILKLRNDGNECLLVKLTEPRMVLFVLGNVWIFNRSFNANPDASQSPLRLRFGLSCGELFNTFCNTLVTCVSTSRDFSNEKKAEVTICRFVSENCDVNHNNFL